MIFGNGAYSGKGLIDLGVPVAVLAAAGLFFLGPRASLFQSVAEPKWLVGEGGANEVSIGLDVASSEDKWFN
jgi:hypothetical protein